MPFYEYKCDHCDHELEVLQKISDDPLKTCPECGRDALVKMISAPGFRLSGGGWYETDFKSSKQKNLASGDGKSSDGDSKSKPKEAPEKSDTKSASSDA